MVSKQVIRFQCSDPAKRNDLNADQRGGVSFKVFGAMFKVKGALGELTPPFDATDDGRRMTEDDDESEDEDEGEDKFLLATDGH